MQNYGFHNTPDSLPTSIGWYLSGYADGEGSFCVSFSPSKKHLLGWEVRPSFSVSQNGDRAEVIHLFMNYFRCGSIRPDRSDKTIKFEIRSVEDLKRVVIPHFQQYPLISGKKNDFLKFSKVVQMMVIKRHHSVGGFTSIVREAFQMNPSGKRKFSSKEILSTLKQR